MKFLSKHQVHGTRGLISSLHSSFRFSNPLKSDVSDSVSVQRPTTDNSRSRTRDSSMARRGPSGSEADIKEEKEIPRELDGEPSPIKDLLFQNNQVHASEALQCRESVKNFVVNATDAKDECDGLVKAYDITCSGNELVTKETITCCSSILSIYHDLCSTDVEEQVLHASEALQCRESVKNFVVNATDAKDECDGLVKAYDTTCSGNELVTKETITCCSSILSVYHDVCSTDVEEQVLVSDARLFFLVFILACCVMIKKKIRQWLSR